MWCIKIDLLFSFVLVLDTDGILHVAFCIFGARAHAFTRVLAYLVQGHNLISASISVHTDN